MSDDSQSQELELYDIINDKKELQNLAAPGKVRSAIIKETLDDLESRLDVWSDDIR